MTALTLTKTRPSSEGRKVAYSRAAVFVVLAVIWEAVSRLEILDSSEFPPFTVVAGQFVASLPDSSTWTALGQTALGWFFGMVISIVVGVGLAFIIGPSSFLTRSTSLVVDVLRSTPAPALIFIMVLVFGTTLTMKVALIFSAAVFPIFIQTLYGVRGIEPVLKDLQRSYRIQPRVAFLRIRVPAALPYIATGVRVSSSLALIVAVVAEYLGGVSGVGSLVESVRLIGDFPRMYALILLVGFFSVGLNLAVLMIERRLLRWHPTHRRA
jgi:ABC-type nitrate/sulfonate/bicarbonate transport system permease component